MTRFKAARTIHSESDPPRDPKAADGRQITSIAIDQLNTDPNNPRRHDRAQLNAIARSIRSFGFNAPILVDRANQIIAGHGRLEAARLAGLARVPVVRLDHLDPAQARAYMLADNKLTDRSSWDEALLAQQLKDLSEMTLDFDVEDTGFELAEIDLHIQSLDDPEVADQADAFDPAAEPAVSVEGDLWILGSHRLLCGNALDPAAYKMLLDGEKAAAVFTDPPYNVRIDGHVGGKGATKHREFVMAAGEMSEEAFTSFLRTACTTMGSHCVRGALIYAFMDWRHMGELVTAGREAGWDLLNLCVWVKSNGGMGSLYRSRHELVFVFRNGRAKHRNNVQLGRFGRNRTNVWNYPGANGFARKGRQTGLELHPTSKPIALVADAIQDATARGDIILDPFAGAGPTVLAAERTARRGFGIELDPLYVDTTIARWERLTGKGAHHASGKTVRQMRIERGLG